MERESWIVRQKNREEKSPHPLPRKLLSLFSLLSPLPPWSFFFFLSLLLSILPGEERAGCDKKPGGEEERMMRWRGEEKRREDGEINSVDSADK